MSAYQENNVILKKKYKYGLNCNSDTSHVLKFIENGFQMSISGNNIKGMSQWQNENSTTRTTVIQAMGDKYLQLLKDLTTIPANQLKNLINGIKLAATAPIGKGIGKKLQFDDSTVSTALSVYKKILENLKDNKTIKKEVLEAISNAIYDIWTAFKDKDKDTIYSQLLYLRNELLTRGYKIQQTNSTAYMSKKYSLNFSNLCNLFNLNFDHDLQICVDGEFKSIDYANDLKTLYEKFESIKNKATQQEINDYCYTLLKVINKVSKNKGDFSNPDKILETVRDQLREVLPCVKNYTPNDGSEVNVATLRNVAMDFELVALEDDIQQNKKSDEKIANELQTAAGLILKNSSKGESELELISDETTKPTPDQQASFITVLTEVYLHKNTCTQEKALTYLKAMMATYKGENYTNDTIKSALQKAIGNVIDDYALQISNSSMHKDKEDSAEKLKTFVEMKPELLTTDHIKKIIDIVKNIQQYHDETVENKLKEILTTLSGNEQTPSDVKGEIDTFLNNQKQEYKENIKKNFANWCSSVFTLQDGNTVKKDVNINDIKDLLGFCKKHTEMKLTPEQLQALAKADIYIKENEEAITQLIDLANGNKDVINTIMEKLKDAKATVTVTVTKEMFEALKNAVFTGSGTGTKLTEGVNANDVIALCAKHKDVVTLTPEQLQALAKADIYKKENEEAITQLIKLAKDAKATSVINTIMEKLKGAGDDVVKELFESLVQTMFTTSGDTVTLNEKMKDLVPSFVALCAKQEKTELTQEQLQALAKADIYKKENEEAIGNFVALLEKMQKNGDLKEKVKDIANSILEKLEGLEGLEALKDRLETLKGGG